jgi:hypothetical protein
LTGIGVWLPSTSVASTRIATVEPIEHKNWVQHSVLEDILAFFPEPLEKRANGKLNQYGGGWVPHACKLLFAEAEHLLARRTGSGEVVNLYQIEHRPVRIQTTMLDRENLDVGFRLLNGMKWHRFRVCGFWLCQGSISSQPTPTGWKPAT